MATKANEPVEPVEEDEAGKYFEVQVPAPTNPKDARVLLWEKDEAHPNGEALIYSNSRVKFKVGETPTIVAMLKAGTLERAGSK